MPIFNVAAEWDEADETFLKPPARCFVCGRILGDDLLIYWVGRRPDHHVQDSPQTWLHVACALNLSACLTQDAVHARSLLSSRP
jgi:hypothetical protein